MVSIGEFTYLNISDFVRVDAQSISYPDNVKIASNASLQVVQETKYCTYILF